MKVIYCGIPRKFHDKLMISLLSNGYANLQYKLCCITNNLLVISLYKLQVVAAKKDRMKRSGNNIILQMVKPVFMKIQNSEQLLGVCSIQLPIDLVGLMRSNG